MRHSVSGIGMDSTRRRVLRLLPGVLVAVQLAVASGADSPEEFVRRIGKTKGASAVVNLRQDNSLGSIAIALTPQLVADRTSLEPLLAQMGEFAAGRQFRATVVTPNAADGEFLATKLKAAGVGRIKTQPMADFVSIKTTRIFLSPGS
jgi:hypothetical protein